jgi:hypothetical protein
MIQSIVWGIGMLNVVFVGMAIGAPTERCMDEKLSLREAIGRNNWAYNCGYLGYRQFRSNKYKANGQLRLNIRYPVFSSALESHDWIIAPVNATKGCQWTVFQHYQQIHSCDSILPESVMHICHRTLKKALDLEEITKEQYIQFKREKMAVLFSPSNQMNSLVACDEYVMYREATNPL